MKAVARAMAFLLQKYFYSDKNTMHTSSFWI